MLYLLAVTKRSHLNSCSGQQTFYNSVLSTAELRLDVETNDEIQNTECAVKTLAVLRDGCVLWNLKPTEFVIWLTLAEGNGLGRFWLPTCAILHGMLVFSIALVQMVYYGSVCVNIATGWNLLLSQSRTAELSWSAILLTFFVADYSIFDACWKCFITCLAETSCKSETLSRISQMSFWVANLRFVSTHAFKNLLVIVLHEFSSLPQSATARVAAGLPAFFLAAPEQQR